MSSAPETCRAESRRVRRRWSQTATRRFLLSCSSGRHWNRCRERSAWLRGRTVSQLHTERPESPALCARVLRRPCSSSHRASSSRFRRRWGSGLSGHPLRSQGPRSRRARQQPERCSARREPSSACDRRVEISLLHLSWTRTAAAPQRERGLASVIVGDVSLVGIALGRIRSTIRRQAGRISGRDDCSPIPSRPRSSSRECSRTLQHLSIVSCLTIGYRRSSVEARE
ncbi:hypothetical protein SAMN06295924_106168 [Rathayibacter rathayi NCPPB 2980 = VKM Ac-1601]|nr:hypothetical protein SAMN06295924_106168 [Rathayibacter rathayi NCPPB 2980 = VKM Ac-1601]